MRVQAYRLGASLLALGWYGSSAAQSVNSTTPQTSSIDASQRVVLEEVVVTAERRHTDAQHTPVSATVLSGSDLTDLGVISIDSLQFVTPGATVNNFGQGIDFNIRGIGKAEHNSQTTVGVVTYRDGIATFPGYFQEEPYYDVANVEILRGPQGTFGGQNATGGAVFVNTNDPIIGGGSHGYVEAQYGNYNDAGVQGAVNIPLSDTFAARIAAYGERRDGYYNITGANGFPYHGNNNKLGLAAGRLSLLWKPFDGFSILSKTDVGYLNFGAYPATPYWQTFKTLPNGSPNPRYSDLFNITANAPESARDKFVRSILKIEYDTPSGLKFRSVTGIQNANTQYETDLDGTSSNFVNPITNLPVANTYFYDTVTETQVSQEFNIISPDNQRFTWLLGAFGLWNSYFFPKPYSNFTINVCYPATFAACLYQLQGRNPERNLAVFGQAGFNITDNLKIEVGGRYTASRSTNHVDVMQYGTYIRDDQTVKTHNFSYKVSLGWKASSSQYLYGFVATGFRPGGLNVPVGLGLPAPFEPEKVTSYEAGWKGNFLGGKIRTTVTGFYNNYKNFQVIIGYPTFPTFGIELNVPHATKIYGGEAEAEFNFGDFSLNAGINILHSELGTFYASDPRIATTTACAPLTGPSSATCINLNGRRQTYAPNSTFNIGAEYRFRLGDKDKIIPRLNFGHVGNQWATLFENASLGDRLGDRNILNAQLAWQHGSYTITGYATNLTDQHYAGALNSGLYFAGPPRQYGVKLLKIF